MVLGQVSATAASMAIDKHNGIVQDVDYKAINAELEARPWGDSRKPDIVVDDKDQSQFRLVGDWQLDNNSRRCYAQTRYYTNAEQEATKSAYFYPHLKNSDEYHLYYYYPKQKHPSSTINFSVFDGKQTHEVNLDTKDLKVIGQTSGEWVYVGTFNFDKGITKSEIIQTLKQIL